MPSTVNDKNLYLPPLPATGVVPGSYVNPTIQVDSSGRIVSAVSGTPDTGVVYADDFTSNSTSGSLNWTLLSNGAGSGVFVATSLASGEHPGVFELRTGTGAGGRGGLRQSSSMANPGPNGVLSYEAVIRLPVLSTVLEDYFVNLGFTDNTSGGQGSNAIALRYDSGNWFLYARAGGVETLAVDLGIAPVAGQWTKVRIEVTPTQGALAFVAPSGTPLPQVPQAVIAQAQLPNATQRFSPKALIQKQAGVTLRTMELDYIAYAVSFPNGR
jgi:hypothetical protein